MLSQNLGSFYLVNKIKYIILRKEILRVVTHMNYKGIMIHKHYKNSRSLINIIKSEVGFKSQIPIYNTFSILPQHFLFNT